MEGSAGVLEKGHGDETLGEPSSFDKFSEDLYKRIIDYLSDEKIRSTKTQELLEYHRPVEQTHKCLLRMKNRRRSTTQA